MLIIKLSSTYMIPEKEIRLYNYFIKLISKSFEILAHISKRIAKLIYVKILALDFRQKLFIYKHSMKVDLTFM